MKHGFGKYTYKDGTTYQGDWISDTKAGRGTLTYPNGNQFSGHFDEEQQEGTAKWGDWDLKGYRKKG
jgi:hypothetical protein